MNITERIVHLIDEVLKITKKKAAEEMGSSYATIQNVTNGKTAHPKSDLLTAWKEARPDINMNWLIGGQGQPLLSMEPKAPKAAAPAPAPVVAVAPVSDLPRDTEVLQIKLQAAEDVIES
ncbi:MAG: hypothetical protein NWR72_01190, partial [Bacteroidia bacterium]|nr:hypothetical protein [Bacteroidia bacterium]